jgi:hypothetical protein
MRKFYLLLLLVFITSPASFGQQTQMVAKITHNYFRSDPFPSEFSSFLKHLLNDPGIADKTLEKRTDSTLFYFEGTYTKYNPFFFKPTRVKIALTETAINIDSLPTDTIYIYQLFAFGNGDKKGIEEVKKEFDKIFRRYKNSFSNNTLTINPGGDKLDGATYNFFDKLHAVSPFALTWVGPDENKEMCLVLTIRMDNHNNMAILPVPFYTP